MDGQEVNVVADNTDVLILLMHHWRDSMADVYILSESKSTMQQRKACKFGTYVIWLPKLKP